MLLVRLLHVPGCPLVERVRATLQECVLDAGITVTVEDVEGPYPSPTLVIDGLDVTTGAPPAGNPSCRLDLPTRGQILEALHASRS